MIKSCQYSFNMKLNILIDNPTLNLSICIGILILSILIVIFNRKAINKQKAYAESYQKTFFRSVIGIVDFDRTRISQNIHDEVGTILTIIKLNLTKISRNTGDVELTKKLLNESLVLLENTIENTREISKELMPQTLMKLGYESGVMELCRQINSSNEISIIVNPSENEVRLFPVIELEVYHVVQEVLNNIIKHGKPKEIIVTMQSNENEITTEIFHNGIGLDAKSISILSESGKGSGLQNIQKRLELICGSVEYNTNGNNKSTVTITVPVD